MVVAPVANLEPQVGSRRVTRLTLGTDAFLPIRTAFDAEPLAPVVAALAAATADGSAVSLELAAAPKSDRWRAAATSTTVLRGDQYIGSAGRLGRMNGRRLSR